MVVETAIVAAAAEGIAEATVVEAAEATAETVAESSISGATELSETLSAIEKGVSREVINERVDAMLQNEAFCAEILEATEPQFPDFSEHCAFETHL